VIDLVWRLEQWGEWHRRGSIKPKQTGSFEGQYRSPQCWEAPPMGKREPPNQEDAWELETASRCIGLKYHFALYLRYVARRNAGEMAMDYRRSVFKMRMTSVDVDNLVGSAQVRLWEQLQAPAVVRKARAAEWVKRQLPPIVESGIEEAYEGVGFDRALAGGY
jgi:hypothetical protein